MNLKQKISEINAEWADAGDDVPVELQYIRLLENRINNAAVELYRMIDGGEECRGVDGEISKILGILEGVA